MPWFTLNRNFALSTTKGHSVNFKKGERTWVPQGIIAEAMGVGAIPEDLAVVEALTQETPERKSIDAEKRKDLIFAAFEKLMLRAGRGDFSASGHPHPRKLEELLGFEMHQKEREGLWEEYRTKKAEEAN